PLPEPDCTMTLPPVPAEPSTPPLPPLPPPNGPAPLLGSLDEHALASIQPRLMNSALTVNCLDLLMPNPSQRRRRRARQIHGEREHPQRDTSAQLCLVAPIRRERRHHQRQQAVPPRLAPE